MRRVWEVRETMRAHALGETQRSEKLALGGRRHQVATGHKLGTRPPSRLERRGLRNPRAHIDSAPPALGSGSWARRARACSPQARVPMRHHFRWTPLLGPPADPQAAIAPEHVITTNGISRLGPLVGHRMMF